MNTAPLKVLLVDDEPPAREWLRTLLAAHPELQIVGEAESVHDAVELAKRYAPEVIFLDIQMPPTCGFDLLPQLEGGPRIVFVTAFDHFAVRAFEANALDYLLKPVHPERLAETVRRLFVAAPSLAAPPSALLTLHDLVPLRDRGTLALTPVGEIIAIEAEGAYTRVHLHRHPPRLILRALGEWEALLPCPPFVRLGRSLLLNIHQLRSAIPRGRNGAQLYCHGTSQPFAVGRGAAARLRSAVDALSPVQKKP